MIEKVIHQIWVGKNRIPDREAEAAAELREKHPDYEYFFWTDDNLPQIPERLQRTYDLMYDQQAYVYCADMLRWLVVFQYGGWYLDIDWKYIQNINDFFQVFSDRGYFCKDLNNLDGIVFGHYYGYDWLLNGVEPGWNSIDPTVTNNIFCFKKSNPLLKFMIDNMPECHWVGNPPYSPHWTGETIKKYLGLEMEFTQDDRIYHSTMRNKLSNESIDYAAYAAFDFHFLRHMSLYSWSPEYKEKLRNGEIS
jgi:mannosyltransferase OCH1-like enzyme